MSVGLSEKAALRYIETICPTSNKVTVACINSSNNVTLSRDERSLDSLRVILDGEKVFNRKLIVGITYHSPQMNQITADYLKAIQTLECGQPPIGSPIIVSTVTGQRITTAELYESQYWVRNLVSQVRFSDAVLQLVANSGVSRKKLGATRQGAVHIHQFLEVGPQSALRAPVRTIIGTLERDPGIGYDRLLTKENSALQTVLEAVGRLHCLGYRVNFDQVNNPSGKTRDIQALIDLPKYPFDHSRRY